MQLNIFCLYIFNIYFYKYYQLYMKIKYNYIDNSYCRNNSAL